MTIALWITAVLLTVVYLLAGATKVARSKAQLQPQMGWVEDFSEPQVTAIGALEVLGALGVILPLATGMAPFITPVAAFALVLVQVAAIVVHVRRGEQKALPVNVVLLLLAATVGVLALTQ
jgi:uncharacterized membrane protein YphA (DoxX/SURF4 family)